MRKSTLYTTKPGWVSEKVGVQSVLWFCYRLLPLDACTYFLCPSLPLDRERKLFLQLGLSFFLFGLINNGERSIQCQCALISAYHISSAVRDNTFCSTRPRPALNTQRHHRIL